MNSYLKAIARQKGHLRSVWAITSDRTEELEVGDWSVALRQGRT